MLTRAWRWLFPTQRLTLELRGSIVDTVAQLRGRILPRGFRSTFNTGVTGRVDECGVKVRYQRAWVRNDMAPVFVGRFVTTNHGLCLTGEFRSRLWTRIFLAFWFGFILLWWAAALAITIGSKIPRLPLPIVILGPPPRTAPGPPCAQTGRPACAQ